MSIERAMSLTSDERPNILFIMTDQQRGDALSIEGHPALMTPNMDSIAGAAPAPLRDAAFDQPDGRRDAEVPDAGRINQTTKRREAGGRGRR